MLPWRLGSHESEILSFQICLQLLTEFKSNVSFVNFCFFVFNPFSVRKEWIQGWALIVPILCRWGDGGVQHQTQAHEARSENSGERHLQVTFGIHYTLGYHTATVYFILLYGKGTVSVWKSLRWWDMSLFPDKAQWRRLRLRPGREKPRSYHQICGEGFPSWGEERVAHRRLIRASPQTRSFLGGGVEG